MFTPTLSPPFRCWLQGAEAAGEKVVISCHVPVEPAALPTATCLAWNYDEVRQLRLMAWM